MTPTTLGHFKSSTHLMIVDSTKMFQHWFYPGVLWLIIAALKGTVLDPLASGRCHEKACALCHPGLCWRGLQEGSCCLHTSFTGPLTQPATRCLCLPRSVLCALRPTLALLGCTSTPEPSSMLSTALLLPQVVAQVVSVGSCMFL